MQDEEASLTLIEWVLLVQVEVGVDVGVLGMVWRYVEHLQPCCRVVGHRGHPLCMKPLCCQSLCVAQLRAQLWPSHSQSLSL